MAEEFLNRHRSNAQQLAQRYNINLDKTTPARPTTASPDLLFNRLQSKYGISLNSTPSGSGTSTPVKKTNSEVDEILRRAQERVDVTPTRMSPALSDVSMDHYTSSLKKDRALDARPQEKEEDLKSYIESVKAKYLNPAGSNANPPRAITPNVDPNPQRSIQDILEQRPHTAVNPSSDANSYRSVSSILEGNPPRATSPILETSIRSVSPEIAAILKSPEPPKIPSPPKNTSFDLIDLSSPNKAELPEKNLLDVSPIQKPSSIDLLSHDSPIKFEEIEPPKPAATKFPGFKLNFPKYFNPAQRHSPKKRKQKSPNKCQQENSPTKTPQKNTPIHSPSRPLASPRRIQPDVIVNLTISEIISQNLNLKSGMTGSLPVKAKIAARSPPQTSPLKIKTFDEYVNSKQIKFSKIRSSRAPDLVLKQDKELQDLMEEEKLLKSKLAELAREKDRLRKRVQIILTGNDGTSK